MKKFSLFAIYLLLIILSTGCQTSCQKPDRKCQPEEENGSVFKEDQTTKDLQHAPKSVSKIHSIC